jgi:adenosylcobinamide-GDP ribazoletransferase
VRQATGAEAGTAAQAEARRARTPLPSPLLALEFLTVLRLRRPRVVPPDQLAAAQLWYPAVGLLIGLALLSVDRLLEGLLPIGPASALILVLLVGIPGFLHLDGLADAADGLLCQQKADRRMAIMRDSSVGAFGVAALGLTLVLAYAAIESLRGSGREAALLLAPVAGRAAMVVVGGLFPYAREQGLGTGFHAAARSWRGVLALASAIAIAVVAAGPGGLALVIAGFAVALGVGFFARVRIGGVTGDVIGASCELSQVCALTLACALQSHGWLRIWL